MLGRFVTPAMEWAREHLERIASAAAGYGDAKRHSRCNRRGEHAALSSGRKKNVEYVCVPNNYIYVDQSLTTPQVFFFFFTLFYF